MKNLRSKFTAFLLLSTAMMIFTFCSKEPVNIQTPPYQLDENYRFGDLSDDLKVHNEVMDEVFNNEISFTDDESYISAIISSVESKTNETLDEEQKSFVHDTFNKYLKVETPEMINKFVQDGMMSFKAANAFMKIDNHMLSKELATYREIAEELAFVQKEFIDANNELSAFDKHQLTVFLEIVDNSANHYQDQYQYEENSLMSRESCRKCIRKKLWQILLADGVGGAVLGVAACIVFPPACPAIIPALIAVGSGAAVLDRCPQCF